ncbi:MAG: methyltransferase [Myxococcota bacterium]
MNPPAGSPDPAGRLLRLLGGKWIAAAISAAATLRIPDALADGPLSLEDLAARVECDASALERLLRVLHGENLVRRDFEANYHLTDDGHLLRRGALGELAEYVGTPFGWDPWSSLPHAVRTGEAAFAERHGTGLFEYLDAANTQDTQGAQVDPGRAAEAELYHAAIDSFSRAESKALAEAFDFTPYHRVADIGGGRGALLVDVLKAWPSLEGILLERPAATAQAEALFAAEGLSSRCEIVVGDFFETLPAHADICVLKHILHSWDDATSQRLLERCRDLVGPSGRVLVIEGVLLPGGRPNLTSLLDLEMLVLCGPGHERSKPEIRRLLHNSGLRLESSVPLAESARLFVTQPR